MTALFCAIPILLALLVTILIIAACTMSGRISDYEEQHLGIRRS